VKVVSFRVDASIGSLNDAVNAIAGSISVCPFRGVTVSTVGGTRSNSVTKVQLTVLPSILPATSVTDPDTYPVSVVLHGRTEAGVNVAVRIASLYVVVPDTPEIRTDELVIVVGFMSSLNFTVITEESGTSVSPSSGDLLLTVGA